MRTDVLLGGSPQHNAQGSPRDGAAPHGSGSPPRRPPQRADRLATSRGPNGWSTRTGLRGLPARRIQVHPRRRKRRLLQGRLRVRLAQRRQDPADDSSTPLWVHTMRTLLVRVATRRGEPGLQPPPERPAAVPRPYSVCNYASARTTTTPRRTVHGLRLRHNSVVPLQWGFRGRGRYPLRHAPARTGRQGGGSNESTPSAGRRHCGGSRLFDKTRGPLHAVSK